MCFNIKGEEDMNYIITRSIVTIDETQVDSLYVLQKITDIDEITGEIFRTNIVMASKKRGDCVRHRKSLTGGK